MHPGLDILEENTKRSQVFRKYHNVLPRVRGGVRMKSVPSWGDELSKYLPCVFRENRVLFRKRYPPRGFTLVEN